MAIKKIATLVLLLGVLGAASTAGIASAQDPPPYGSGDATAPPPAPDQGAEAPPPDGAAAADPATAGIDYFHSQMSPYGQWVIRPGYGEVWVPNVVPGWRPYTTGHWLYTDQGWAWAADEPWGWAAFHYGRWYYDSDIGWGWVPGYTWAPAWVAWRHGGGYLGWAPLSPAVGFSFGGGLAFGSVTIGTGFYTFCGERDILAPHIGGYIVPTSRNVTFINNTTNITNYTVVNNRVVNVGVTNVAAVVGHPVQPVAVASLTSARAGGHPMFYQPAVIAHAARVTPNEFGGHLAAQVAVQQRSRSWATLKATPAGAGHLTARSATAAPGAGARSLGTSHGAGASNESTRNGAPAGSHLRSTGASGSTGSTGHRNTAPSGTAGTPRPTGTAGGTTPKATGTGAGTSSRTTGTGGSAGTRSTATSQGATAGSTGTQQGNRSAHAGTSSTPPGAQGSKTPPASSGNKGQTQEGSKGHKPPPAD